MPQKGKYRPSQRREKKQGEKPAQNINPADSQATQPVVAPEPRPVAAATRTTVKIPGKPGAGPQLPMAKERYPYLSRELKWIGIIAIGLVIVLIVLAIVIPPIFA